MEPMEASGSSSEKQLDYCCGRCGYRTTTYTKLKIHLEKKKTCEATLADVSREEVLRTYEENRDRKTYTLDDKAFKCICGKAYAYDTSLKRHQETCPNCKTEVAEKIPEWHRKKSEFIHRLDDMIRSMEQFTMELRTMKKQMSSS